MDIMKDIISSFSSGTSRIYEKTKYRNLFAELELFKMRSESFNPQKFLIFKKFLPLKKYLTLKNFRTLNKILTLKKF